MLFTNREEQLIKAFLELGKLSVKEMMELLKVSTRTVYRTISDLTISLEPLGIQLIKEGKKYYLEGDLQRLESDTFTMSSTPTDRLLHLTYLLLSEESPITNEVLQERLFVSNVTIIQDIALIEERLAHFNLTLNRQKGYMIQGDDWQKRRVLAIVLSNAISIQEFANGQWEGFSHLEKNTVAVCKKALEGQSTAFGTLDPKIKEFLTFLLALADNRLSPKTISGISKDALTISQTLFKELSDESSSRFYNIQEIVSFAKIIDETVLKRQEVPLYRERFDSEFYYSVSQLIDSVSRFTKIDFIRDKALFTFLFHHLKLALAVPVLYPEGSSYHVASLVTKKNEYLNDIVSLVVCDIFPSYLNSEYEHSLITLHFASSLRRSPDIYPIRVLLVTDERPLMTNLLITKMQSIAPFVGQIKVVSSSELEGIDLQTFDYTLSTKPVLGYQFDTISAFPSAKEILELQECLQRVQENITVRRTERPVETIAFDLQAYLHASSQLLKNFRLMHVQNTATFEKTVFQLIQNLQLVNGADYLADKLLRRFEESPLAIPNTNLALLHTQSHTVLESHFVVIDLEQPVEAKSMTHGREQVKRILVMLTKLDESEEVRNLMTAISQSILENNLYTEIYRTGNQEIIYHLLNTIFNEKIKKLEN